MYKITKARLVYTRRAFYGMVSMLGILFHKLTYS